jgi:hypothetical protein
MTDSILQKAMKLAEDITKQINEVNSKCLQEMEERGYDPDMYVLENNLLAVLEDPTIPYECKAVLKPRMNRGENK